MNTFMSCNLVDQGVMAVDDISYPESCIGIEYNKTSSEAEVLVAPRTESSSSSEDSVAQQLTLKLLTSPENLDFALGHQEDKILELKDKLLTLLEIKSDQSAQTHYDGVTLDSALKSISSPYLQETHLDQEVCDNNKVPLQQAMVMLTREESMEAVLIVSKEGLMVNTVKEDMSKFLKETNISPVQHQSNEVISDKLMNGITHKEHELESVQFVPTQNFRLQSEKMKPSPSLNLTSHKYFRNKVFEHFQPAAQMMATRGMTDPHFVHNKRHRTSRSKNRQRDRYIQLPPTFKYPEPIDVSSIRLNILL